MYNLYMPAMDETRAAVNEADIQRANETYEGAVVKPDVMCQVVFDKYESDAANAVGVTKLESELGKEHIKSVHKLAVEIGEKLDLNPREKYLLEIAAYAHDAEKYTTKRDTWQKRLLIHAHDSRDWTREFLTQQNMLEEDIDEICDAILRHQPMPFVSNALNGGIEDMRRFRAAQEQDPTLTEENTELSPWYYALRELMDHDPEIFARGYFLGPEPNGSKVAEALYCADLMSLGVLYSGDLNNPAVGAGDKIIGLQLDYGSTLESSVESLITSLSGNVRALQNHPSPNVRKVGNQFADKYNKLIEDLRQALSESDYKDYVSYEGKEKLLKEKGENSPIKDKLAMSNADMMREFYLIAQKVLG